MEGLLVHRKVDIEQCGDHKQNDDDQNRSGPVHKHRGDRKQKGAEHAAGNRNRRLAGEERSRAGDILLKDRKPLQRLCRIDIRTDQQNCGNQADHRKRILRAGIAGAAVDHRDQDLDDNHNKHHVVKFTEKEQAQPAQHFPYQTHLHICHNRDRNQDHHRDPLSQFNVFGTAGFTFSGGRFPGRFLYCFLLSH